MERRLARLSHTLRTVGCSYLRVFRVFRVFRSVLFAPARLVRCQSVLSVRPCLFCSRPPASPVCPSWSVLFAPARPAPSRLPVLSCLPCLSCSRQLGWRASVRKILTTENLEFNISKTGFRPSEARFFMLSRHKNTVPHAKTVNLALQNSQSYAPKQSVLHAKIVNLTLQDSQSYAPKQPVFSLPVSLYFTHSATYVKREIQRVERAVILPVHFFSSLASLKSQFVALPPVLFAPARQARSSRAPPACSPSPR